MKFKSLLIFGTGFALGFASSYILLRDRLEKECQERNDEFKKDYAKAKRKAEVEKMVGKATDSSDNTNESKAADAAPEKIFNSPAERAKEGIDLSNYKKAYNKMAKSYNDISSKDEEPTEFIGKEIKPETLDEPEEPDEDDIEELDDENDIHGLKLHPTDDPAEEPYSITADAFANDYLYHDKVTFIFWDDGVLTDDSEEMITDYGRLIGNDFAGKIGEFEPDVAYIRNEKVGSDYEILAEHRSYIKSVIYDDK